MAERYRTREVALPSVNFNEPPAYNDRGEPLFPRCALSDVLHYISGARRADGSRIFGCAIPESLPLPPRKYKVKTDVDDIMAIVYRTIEYQAWPEFGFDVYQALVKEINKPGSFQYTFQSDGISTFQKLQNAKIALCGYLEMCVIARHWIALEVVCEAALAGAMDFAEKSGINVRACHAAIENRDRRMESVLSAMNRKTGLVGDTGTRVTMEDILRELKSVPDGRIDTLYAFGQLESAFWASEIAHGGFVMRRPVMAAIGGVPDTVCNVAMTWANRVKDLSTEPQFEGLPEELYFQVNDARTLMGINIPGAPDIHLDALKMTGCVYQRMDEASNERGSFSMFFQRLLRVHRLQQTARSLEGTRLPTDLAFFIAEQAGPEPFDTPYGFIAESRCGVETADWREISPFRSLGRHG